MANNTSLGVENISVQGNYSGTEVDSLLGDLGSTFSGQLAGSTEMTGVILLGLMSFALFKSDVSSDVSAAVLIPSTFLLASRGFLPYGNGIIYGMVLAISGVFIFGVLRYMK
jgi:hypothetical protein